MNTQHVKTESLEPSFINFPDGRRIAYVLSEGNLPGVVFLGGFKSDMTGTKATTLEAFCRKAGRRFLRFDYTGHGKSSGDFMHGTIGQWKQDTLDVLDKLATGKNILVGSSMGAWIMLLAAIERPEKVAGIVGIASAPDFTERLIWEKLDALKKKELETNGAFYVPDCYGGDPYPITKSLIEDGRRHLLLDGKINLNVPVRLFHGKEDRDVPWQMSVKLMEAITSPNISLELIKGGDHRLSQPAQLEMVCKAVAHNLALSG
jgi:pimeloyl-ACP methyl ester carboxylesterase